MYIYIPICIYIYIHRLAKQCSEKQTSHSRVQRTWNGPLVQWCAKSETQCLRMTWCNPNPQPQGSRYFTIFTSYLAVKRAPTTILWGQSICYLGTYTCNPKHPQTINKAFALNLQPSTLNPINPVTLKPFIPQKPQELQHSHEEDDTPRPIFEEVDPQQLQGPVLKGSFSVYLEGHGS